MKASKAERYVGDLVKRFTDTIVIENDRTQIINPKTGNYLELDIWLPYLRKAIEYNGIIWHSNEYSQYKDKCKVDQCEEKGIELLIILDFEWRNNTKQCNISMIKDFLEEL